MKRIYTQEITRCSECPNKWHDDGDGESPWTSDHCGIVKDDNGKDDKRLIDLKTVPDWCPLPKVKV